MFDSNTFFVSIRLASRRSRWHYSLAFFIVFHATLHIQCMSFNFIWMQDIENEILNYRYYEMASTSWPLSIKCVTSVFSAFSTRKCDRRPHLSIVLRRFACICVCFLLLRLQQPRHFIQNCVYTSQLISEQFNATNWTGQIFSISLYLRIML